MTDELMDEYREALTKLNKFCRRIGWENKFLRQSLDTIRSKYGIGLDDDLPDEAIPLLAMGESFALTKFNRWSYEMRWELKGYYDEFAGWSPEYFATDEAKDLAFICEQMVIEINSIESICRGNWNDLYEMCGYLFYNIDLIETLYKNVVGETDIVLINNHQSNDTIDDSIEYEPLVIEGQLKVNSISAWQETDEIAVVDQVGFFVYGDHDSENGIGITEKELNEWSHKVPYNGNFKVTFEPVVD